MKLLRRLWNESSAIWPLWVFVLGFSAALIQATFAVSPLDHIYSDMQGYIERAWRLRMGAEFMPFDAFYPAGTAYAYAIAFLPFGFADGLKLIIILQSALIAANAVLLGKIAEALYGSRKAVYIAAAIGILYWPFIAQSSFFMAEPLFATLLLLALLYIVRALRSAPARHLTFAAGLLLGLACLVKGQGLAAAGGAALVLCLGGRSLVRRSLPLFLLGLAIPLAFQVGVNSLILKRPAAFLAANDAYNMYLGQTRREAIGCADLTHGLFYIFHNNNAGLDFRFHRPIIEPVSILDRSYFQEQTKALWRESPQRQTLYSLQNLIELFVINPRWPLSNVEWAGKVDVLSQWFFLILVSLPCAYTLVGAVTRRRRIPETLLLLSPVAAVAALSALTSGQPRYLLPFQYYLVLLALPFYLDLFGHQLSPVTSIGRRYAFGALFGGAAFLGLSAWLVLRSAGFLPVEAQQYRREVRDMSSAQAVIHFGRHGRLADWQKGADSLRVFLDGFDPIQSSNLPGRYAVAAEGTGWVRLEFDPAAAPSSVAVELIDQRANIGAIAIELLGEVQIAEQLSAGKSIKFPLSERTIQLGSATLRFRALSGGRVMLKSLVVYGD